jgi:anti-sigma B factor antagonist/stage II sporulation protein AA (anti-sigma F factor antagonist)
MTPLSGLRIDEADGVVVARLSGEIDLANARDTRDTLAAGIPNSALGVVLDLTAVTYLDSSGIHLVFDLAERLRQRQQQLRVAVPEDAPIRRVLRIVELQGVVPMFATVESAVEDIRRGP